MKKKQWLEYYVLFVVALAVVALVLCLSTMSFAHLDLTFFLLAAVTIFLSARVEIQIPHSDGGHITVSDTFIFLTMLLYGGGPATVLAAVESAYSSFRFNVRVKE